MLMCTPLLDTYLHSLVIISIMVAGGWFGGYLNYLHNFDTREEDRKDKLAKKKYILLGIGAAFLVPAFLKMISSNLANSQDLNDYLIFAGFCLIAAIFSRRFITTIGDRILEAAKQAEKTAQESKLKSESTLLELSSAKERIEDVKLAIDLKAEENRTLSVADNEQKTLLIDLANNFVQKTSIPDYAKRLNLKAELGRKMGELIVRNGFLKEELLENHLSEGMLLALSYAVELSPNAEGLHILKKISPLAKQLYTKYTILVSIDTLARRSFITRDEVPEITSIANSFRVNADSALIRKIDATLGILSLINPIRKE